MNDGDAGLDATPPDAAVTLTDQEIQDISEALCASYDALADCDAEPGCVATFVGQLEFLTTNPPPCVPSIDAYFTCMAAEPIESFTCDGDTASFATDTVNCDEEYCDFVNCQAGMIVCP